MEELHEREAARLAELLSLLVRVSGRSQRALEQELELSGVGEILNGRVGLRLGHVLMILGALGVDPGDFFRWAYPFRGQPSELIENARTLGPEPEAGGSEAAQSLPDTAFDERVRQSILRLLRSGD